MNTFENKPNNCSNSMNLDLWNHQRRQINRISKYEKKKLAC